MVKISEKPHAGPWRKRGRNADSESMSCVRMYHESMRKSRSGAVRRRVLRARLPMSWSVAQYEEAGKRCMGQDAEKGRGRKMNEHALNGLDAELEQRQWEIGAIVEHLREMKERCGKHRRYQDLLKLAINDLLYVDDSLMTIRKILEESCPKN